MKRGGWRYLSRFLLLARNLLYDGHKRIKRNLLYETVKQLNVYRWCLECGYEQFEKEDVHIDDKDRKVSEGFINCPKCKGKQFALGG